MSRTQHVTMVPRAALAGAAALIAVTLLGVFALPRGAPNVGFRASAIDKQRLLRFADRDDGAVLVTDGADGHELIVVTGQNGFFRGTLSGLARIRRTAQIGAGPPFRLTLYADHRLVLDDPATGHAVELEAFGPTNEAVFAALLP